MVIAVNEPLWKRVDLAINHARTRLETLSEINRLLRKWNVGAPDNYITEGSSIRQEWLTPQQLAQLRRGHPRGKPRSFDGPLVAVEFGGAIYMLDGTNRINVWLRDGNKEAHEIIILGSSEP